MLIIIDNYDSFTYNLFQLLAQLKPTLKISVIRNDQLTVADLADLNPTHLVISPGPGEPTAAGISMAALKHFAGKIPVLGVCLGHQALAAVFGGKVIRAPKLMHGKTSEIYHDQQTLYQHLPLPFTATRYHSLIVEKDSLPPEFTISSWTAEEEIMGLRHKPTQAEGVQFHPESILTTAGEKLLAAFIQQN